MVKKFFIIIAVIMIGFIYAGQTTVSVTNYDSIELFFENVIIDDIKFEGKSDIKIEFDSEDDVTVKRKSKRVIITASDEKTKIRLILPNRKTYYYTMNKSDKEAYCQFTKDKFTLYEDDEKVVTFKEGILLITNHENETVIKVDDEKIYIRDEEGNETEISSEGITSTENEDNDQFDGFWGKMLGNAIQYGAQLALSEIGDSPGTVAKFFINSDLDEDSEINIKL
jgi:hypothetical protein